MAGRTGYPVERKGAVMGGRAVATWNVDVKRSPEDVFAYLTDISKHAEWSPKPYRVESLEGPIGAGSRFVSYGWIPRDADHRNDVEVTEYQPATRLTMVSKDAGGQTVNTYVLTPVAGGTKVARTMDLPKPPGVAGALFPLIMTAVVKPGVNKGMQLFKQNLERTA
jgi:uncharacterized protein YndB with AHSA1/START domain